MDVRPRRLLAMSVGAVAAGALFTGAAMATGCTHPGTEVRGPLPRQATGVPWGAYLGSGPEGVLRMQRFERWLGETDLKVGHTYLGGHRWRDIEGDPRVLRAWSRWKQGAAGRLFVLNVPMLERNEEEVPDDRVAVLLRQGAGGGFDTHFLTLARRLTGLGLQDAVIVLGWEMNGTTYTGRCAPHPQAWRAYFRSIVTAMRSVPGQRFRFEFTPSRGRDAIPWTRCYPGDDVVDIVGMDSYDQPPGDDFDDQVDQPFGLRRHVEFATAHRKPFSYPEWGLFRNGDNAEYMRRMLAWIAENPPEYHTLTDYCPHGVWSCDENSRASQVFRSVQYSPEGTAPEPEPEHRAEDHGLFPARWLDALLGQRRQCTRKSRRPC
ncbi:glycoside hydrolase family 26 protein [Streptomyces meridianus]|uniref:GH26 domain-containing protein n=1 Tax=Streptomyces meridianus TaxID=2938945 RepID=A0ABT0X6U2_9ACTN|nr:glycosyl hydrolase [Streptomyces meridianus]MCM2578242.1 hypothetical protein [Streptomyces meridianus]